MKSALILYPNQLFSVDQLPDVDTVVMVEDPLFFGIDREFPQKLHKQKLILHRASMRRYVEEVLWPAKRDVDYISLDVLYDSSDIFERTKKFEQLYIIDPVNETLTRRLLEARRERGSTQDLQFLPSPNFYLKDQEVREYFSERHKQPFADFYQWQRERFNVLIGDDYRPVGGEWTFDDKPSIRLPKDEVPPSFAVFGDNKFVEDATLFVQEHFSDNPGSTDFIWPTSHQEAAAWLEDFVENRLDKYADYRDTIDSEAPWLYHSVLSSSLNIGLLSPQQVIGAALKRHGKREVPIESLENFIRQVLGWREFIRGAYVTKRRHLRESNVFRQDRKLTGAWFSGDLGIPPYDDLMKKIARHGYAHRTERLMVAGNLMLLAEIHPDEVYRWFNELLIDSCEWETVPSVYSISQFADGGSLVSKPFIAASSYILQVSNYERGIWCDVWDGLFWRFIERHRGTIAHNPHMRVMAQRLDRLDEDHRRVIGYRADDFLTRYTLQ